MTGRELCQRRDPDRVQSWHRTGLHDGWRNPVGIVLPTPARREVLTGAFPGLEPHPEGIGTGLCGTRDAAAAAPEPRARRRPDMRKPTLPAPENTVPKENIMPTATPADRAIGRASSQPPTGRIENQGVTTVLWPQTAEDARQINATTGSGVLVLTEGQALELMRQLAYHLGKQVAG